MPAISNRIGVLTMVLGIVLAMPGTAAAQPSGRGNIVPGDSGERRWDRRTYERLNYYARRAEDLRRAGKCEAFYRTLNDMSNVLSYVEHDIGVTGKFNPSAVWPMRMTYDYFNGYLTQLRQLDCPPGSSLAPREPKLVVDGAGRTITDEPPTEQQPQTTPPPAEQAAPVETPAPAESAPPPPETPDAATQTSAVPVPRPPATLVLPGTGLGSLAGTYRMTLPAAGSNSVTIVATEGGYMLTGMGTPILLKQQGAAYVGEGTMNGQPNQFVQLQRTSAGLELTTSGADGRSTTRSLAAVEHGQ